MTDSNGAVLSDAQSIASVLGKYDSFTKVMAKGVMTLWVDAVVSRHWTESYKISDQKKFVCYYIRARHLKNGANATWYRNRHAKQFKSFANSSHDIKHYAEAISPKRGNTHVSLTRFKGAGKEEFEEIQRTEKEMVLIRRVQEHFSTIRKSLQGIKHLMDQSELLVEMSEHGLINLADILKELPPEISGDGTDNEDDLEDEQTT